MIVADAADVHEGLCHLCLLGMQLSCILKMLVVAASTDAEVRTGSCRSISMLSNSFDFPGLSIACEQPRQNVLDLPMTWASSSKDKVIS